MKIDTSKLKHVVDKGGGKITAQCPACDAEGGDAKGEHLAVFPNGKFGCVVHEGDKVHNRTILKLVGTKDRGDGGLACRLTVNPMRVEESRVLMKVGRLGRVKPSPEGKCVNQPMTSPAAAVVPREANQAEPPARKSGAFIRPCLSPEISDATLRDFLDLPAVAA